MSTDEFALYDAAYVLGALSPTERREFEDHVKSCAACASSVGELAGLPGLMSKVSLQQLIAEAQIPPETLLPSLARAVRRERGRRRIAVGAAAAAAAGLVAVAGVALERSDPPALPSVPSPSATTSAPSGSANLAMKAVVASPVTASARLVDMAWGTRIDLTCSYKAAKYSEASGFSYALVVIDNTGAAQQVATWMALPGRSVTVMGASALIRKNIAAVEVRTISGKALLRLST